MELTRVPRCQRGGGAIIQARVSKAPPLQQQADSLAHGLFTFASVNPDWEHYSKQARYLGFFFSTALSVKYS